MYFGHKVKVLPTQPHTVHAIDIDIWNSYWSLQFFFAYVYIVLVHFRLTTERQYEEIWWLKNRSSERHSNLQWQEESALLTRLYVFLWPRSGLRLWWRNENENYDKIQFLFIIYCDNCFVYSRAEQAKEICSHSCFVFVFSNERDSSAANTLPHTHTNTQRWSWSDLSQLKINLLELDNCAL